jgi:hypothetical protein
MAHPTPINVPVVRASGESRGAYAVDPRHPPEPPVGARGVEIVDARGETIAFVWIARGHARDIAAEVLEWLDRHDPITRGPRLVR